MRFIVVCVYAKGTLEQGFKSTYNFPKTKRKTKKRITPTIEITK